MRPLSVKTIRQQRPERDDPAGVKGLGEPGNVGANAAMANAVYHATGKRIRALPIRIEDFITSGTLSKDMCSFPCRSVAAYAACGLAG
jgi:hypothetical protein